MSDEDIKKCLEHCVAKGQCKKCPLDKELLCFPTLEKNALALINRQQAEIERLVAECGNQSTLWRQHFESIFETAKETIKSEAIKEFAERLKKEAVTKCDWDNCVDVEDIDRLVAEMVGEQDV